MCVQQGQARAVSIEVVERDCERRCVDPPSPAPACVEVAAAARARVRTVRMRGRAAKVWTELGHADLHCGYQDGLLRTLREASGLDDTARALVLARALRADPFAEQLCPGGGTVTAEQTAVDARRLCAIDDPPQEWHPDIDAQTYLVARAVELRWRALGLLEGDHEILLNTLRLSAALAGRARR